jgi:hypothetical protein
MHRKRILMWLVLGAWHLTALAQSSVSSPTPTPTSNSASRTAASDAALAKSSAREVEKYWFERSVQDFIKYVPVGQMNSTKLESYIYTRSPEIMRLRMKTLNLLELEEIFGPWVKEFVMIQDFVEREDTSDEAMNRAFGTKLSKAKRVKHPLGGSFTVATSTQAASPFIGVSPSFELRLPRPVNNAFVTQIVKPPIGRFGFDGVSKVVRELNTKQSSVFFVLQSNSRGGDYEKYYSDVFVQTAEFNYPARGLLTEWNSVYFWNRDQTHKRDVVEALMNRRSGWNFTFQDVGKWYVDQATHLSPQSDLLRKKFQEQSRNVLPKFNDATLLRAFAHQYFHEVRYVGRRGEWTIRRSDFGETLSRWIPSGGGTRNEWQILFEPYRTAVPVLNAGKRLLNNSLEASIATLLASNKSTPISRSYLGASRQFRLKPLAPLAELAGLMNFSVAESIGGVETDAIQHGRVSVHVPSASYSKALYTIGEKKIDKRIGDADVSMSFPVEDTAQCLRIATLLEELSLRGSTVQKRAQSDELGLLNWMWNIRARSFILYPSAQYQILSGESTDTRFQTFEVGPCIQRIEFNLQLALPQNQDKY